MGYMRHHGILVTASGDTAQIVHALAVDIFPANLVSPLQPAMTNNYCSFAVFPDGSKEGWDESNAGDKARERFVVGLRKLAYSDGSSPVDWVVVQYGDDEGVTLIADGNDQ